jgi:predicted NAD/FAD-dependent oxidoreductase
MNQLVKHLSDRIYKHFETRIDRTEKQNGRYELITDDGQSFDHSHLVITAPPAQSRKLVPESQRENFECFDRIEMLPTIAHLVLLEDPVGVDFDGLFVNDNEVLDWVARNSAKPGRSGPETWVLHTDHEWSAEHFDDGDDAVKESIRTAFGTITGKTLDPDYEDLHRWRYSNCEQPLEAGAVRDDRVVLAGDWLSGAKIEGAYCSGEHAAGMILRGLNEPKFSNPYK